jgi:hypothetical protein
MGEGRGVYTVLMGKPEGKRPSGDRIPVGGEIFLACPDRPWGPPSLLYKGYRVFLGGKATGGWR